MRILFYEDPITDRHAFMWRTPHISLDAILLRGLASKGWDCRMLLNDSFADLAIEHGVESKRLFRIDEYSWIALLEDPQENINKLLYQGRAKTESKRMEEAVVANLGGFEPEIIVTWVPVPFLRALFPEALILHRESGIFTRAPYPLTYFLDPCGLMGHSWPAQYVAQSKEEAAHQEIKSLRTYFGSIFDDISPLHDLSQELSRFKKKLLVATQVSEHFSLDAVCHYRSPVHMLRDVLEHTPKDCAVLLGQHPTAERLRSDEQNWLQDRFPNFIHHESFVGIEGISQYLLHIADAVATVSSTVGWQAVFWGRPLIALGKTQLNAMAQTQGVEHIADTMLEDPVDKLDAAAWLVFHYCIPASYLNDPDWLAPYLEERVRHWRSKGAEGYYDTPYAPVNETASRLIKEAGGRHISMRNQPICNRLGKVDIDLAASRMLGGGWSYCEWNGTTPCRWIDGMQAYINLPLTHKKNHRLTLSLSTHPACTSQKVSVFIDGNILKTTRIVSGKTTKVRVTLPAALIKLPVTILKISAVEAKEAPGDARQLSLICRKITVAQSASYLRALSTLVAYQS